MDTIFIKKLQVDAIIGVYPVERKNKQPLIVDIEMSYDTRQAIASDNIKYALDYHKICIEMIEYISSSSFQLIETLAESVAQKILLDRNVASVKITLTKPKALKQTDSVGISIIRPCIN